MLGRTGTKQRSKNLKIRFSELAAQYRALRLPRIADAAARVLVECDRRALLGPAVLVDETNAMAAYELEAMDQFATGTDATEDCNLTWCGEEGLSLTTTMPLFDAMRSVDSTYTVNAKKPFQVRNQIAYEVEFLLPQNRVQTYPRQERIRPIFPDPRYFALHKRWLAEKSERPRHKRQGPTAGRSTMGGHQGQHATSSD